MVTYNTKDKTTTGMTIKYQGTLKLLPNQLTLQDENISIDVSKVVTNKIFFISIHPFTRIIAYSLKNVKCFSAFFRRKLGKELTMLGLRFFYSFYKTILQVFFAYFLSKKKVGYFFTYLIFSIIASVSYTFVLTGIIISRSSLSLRK